MKNILKWEKNMEKKVYNINNFMKGFPFSHVVEAGGFLFLSGIVPVDMGKELVIMDDVKEATELVLENIKYALESVGSDMKKVVKATVFLRDMAYFNTMNDVYKTFFPEDPPARSCVAVKEIAGNLPIEIEVIAIR